MNIQISVIKVANHWYVNLEHIDPITISLPENAERFLNVLDTFKEGIVHFTLREVHSFIDSNTIEFVEEDILRYVETDDNFNLRVYIGNRLFLFSSDLIYQLETKLDICFLDNLYSLDLDYI